VSKDRRLGRGLEALLGRPPEQGEPGPDETAAPTDTAATDAGGDTGLIWLNVYEIDRNPYQPRRDFDEATTRELVESLEQHGMLQPVVVRQVDDRYQLIVGERRLRAATAAGWTQVPAQVRDVDDRQVAELAIVENIQRRDLNSLEKAASFQEYLQQYGCTQEELAGRVNIDRSTVANLIRLLELPDPVKQALRDGAISQGHARALLPLGDEREQIAFCQRIQRESLTVRATEDGVRDMIEAADAEPLSILGSDGRPSTPRQSRSEHLGMLEQELRSALGAKVDLRQTTRGRGRVVIHFKNNEEFERLRYYLLGPSAAAPDSQTG
jgi:ParB family transcriptional regulator, chromosome partitioning protein